MRLAIQTVLALSVVSWLHGSVLADAGSSELRRHFVMTTTSGARGAFTQIVRLPSEQQEQHFLLYESATGERVVIERWTRYPDGEAGIEVRDVSGGSWIRRTYTIPFSGKTRDEFQRKVEQSPQLWAFEDKSAVVVETAGGKWRNPDLVWKQNRREATSALRRSLSFSLLDEIERIVADGFFLVEAAQSAKEMLVNLLLYQPNCAIESPSVAASQPDCAFDAGLGFPCNADQLRREGESKKAGAEPDSY